MSFHQYQINELYSSADGNVQYIEMRVGDSDGESFWRGVSLTSSSGGVTHTFHFPSNLPSQATANTTVLIATQAFADLGIVNPDFIVPAGFLFASGGTLNFGGVDVVAYAALPTDGARSVDAAGTLGVASPTNFSGVVGRLQATVVTPTISGTADNDVLISRQGSDTIDGGAGTDTVVLSGIRSSYTLVRTGNDITLSDTLGTDGIDKMSNVERLKFSDGGIALDVGSTQSAGETALLLGAVLPGKLVFDPGKQALLGAVMALFDQGFTLQQLSGAVMRLPIWDVLTGKAVPTNTDIATYLLSNVNGAVPDATTLTNAVTSLNIEIDFASQGNFLWHLAESGTNQTHVGLVGLAATGLAYGL
jgi:hypothetical protein